MFCAFSINKLFLLFVEKQTFSFIEKDEENQRRTDRIRWW